MEDVWMRSRKKKRKWVGGGTSDIAPQVDKSWRLSGQQLKRFRITG